MENKKQLSITLLVDADDLKEVLETMLPKTLPQETKSSEPEELLKRKDIIALFSISYVTLHQWMKSGRIPYHRINSRIFFKRSEVMKAMEISPKYRRNV